MGFYNITGKSYVKNVLYHCKVCRTFNSRPYPYLVSPDLQKLRVNIDHAFRRVGIDYLGLLYCKNIYFIDLEDDEMHKHYDILYKCATSGVVVLDVVTNDHAGTLLLSLAGYI